MLCTAVWDLLLLLCYTNIDFRQEILNKHVYLLQYFTVPHIVRRTPADFDWTHLKGRFQNFRHIVWPESGGLRVDSSDFLAAAV
jgi:hypothetical protein